MNSIKITLLSLISFLCGSLSNSSAQWVRVPEYYGEPTLTIAQSSLNMYVGSRDSGVYVSTNNGQNWIHTSFNNQFIYCLAISGTYVYAGTSNAVYVSTDNGQNWAIGSCCGGGGTPFFSCRKRSKCLCRDR